MGEKKYSDKGKSGYEIGRAVKLQICKDLQTGKTSDMRGCNSKWGGEKANKPKTGAESRSKERK